MKIVICGDSTAASYTPEQAPQTGWGQVLGELIPEVTVINTAMAGRSTKSFISEGRLIEAEKQLKENDLLLIQFAHNDMNDLIWRHTDAWTSYKTCLSIFIETARDHGAKPVLLTSIPIRDFDGGELKPSLFDYPEAMRVLAREKGVPLIDVYQKGFEKLRELGEKATEWLYMNVPAGEYPGIPNGRTDNVHTQRAGALMYASIVLDGLREGGLV